MHKLRTDKFYILTGRGPDEPGRKMFAPNIWEWTVEDQRILVEKALSETPFLEAKEHDEAEPKACHGAG